jgi:hypothetical protein
MASRDRRIQQESLFLVESRRFPKRAQLDDRTRQVGLAGVAAVRAKLAAQAARRAEAEAAATARPSRHAA